ncbi:tRNA (adenosine(37)-N6)-dimethylallyltransferase MiaA [Microbacterium sp. ARD31]|uniref:tRNA (adenosine(37)-N6)-dimethylallyltransferase MiaA n=1 Tax=Microbacterium sp. ARD31 TaxID=2962576 RepID=UPI0028824223|nr:tRNA (adenosine(37)-N6)-dimethylallyltransferase MiaA [Microbacterium sp. ARD31]MDT0186255.1 tRNA (adenosine(37)-N6)-dimethylallyltransferase MiaA [Microbacterium sp. ARD31]
MTHSDPDAPRPVGGRLWVVVGATGTGKTALSLDLAEALASRGIPAEIVNADAMQVYRGMDIGTAKLPAAERRGIPHHLFDVLDVTDEAAVAWYQDAARGAIGEVHDRGADAILVGGSGLYVSSVAYDFRFPPHDDALRAELEADLERDGPGALYARLRAVDPATAERVDPRNGRRIVRALEILAQGSATHGAALPAAPVLWHADTRIIGVEVPRDRLVPRLDARVEGMWRGGLVDEVRALLPRGLERGVTARRAIGYAQALAQLEGRLSEAEAVAETQALTRRYARRQVSWFRRYVEIRWVEPGADAGTLADSAP